MTHPVSEVAMAGLFFRALMFASESNIFFSCFVFLKATTDSAIRQLKESLAVEKRFVVWVWKNTKTFQKCFTFHFQRRIAVYLWHTFLLFFFLVPH